MECPKCKKIKEPMSVLVDYEDKDFHQAMCFECGIRIVKYFETIVIK